MTQQVESVSDGGVAFGRPEVLLERATEQLRSGDRICDAMRFSMMLGEQVLAQSSDDLLIPVAVVVHRKGKPPASPSCRERLARGEITSPNRTSPAR